MTHPAGWYPDPSNPQQQRYWDGQAWSPYATGPAQFTQPPEKKSPVRMLLTIAGVFLLVVVVISFFTPSDSSDTTTAAPTEVTDPDFTNPTTYTELAERDLQVVIKDPEAAAGQKYVVYGEVTQLDAATGDSSMRVNATATPDPMAFGDNVVVNVRDPALLRPVVAGDSVKLFVTVAGALSYDTQIGGRTTVPEFTAAIVEVLPS